MSYFVQFMTFLIQFSTIEKKVCKLGNVLNVDWFNPNRPTDDHKDQRKNTDKDLPVPATAASTSGLSKATAAAQDDNSGSSTIHKILLRLSFVNQSDHKCWAWLNRKEDLGGKNKEKSDCIWVPIIIQLQCGNN